MGIVWFVLGDAQTEPFDVLRLAEDTSEAQISLDLSLSFHPQGSTGAGYDDLGNLYTFVRFSDQWQSSISVSWSFRPCHRLGAALTRSTTTLYERRLYESTESHETSASSSLSYSSYYEYRVDPGSPLDPRLRLSYRSPSWFGLAISINRLLDPVVLTSMVGLVHQHQRPLNWAELSLSAGLVANSRVTYTVSSGLSTPVQDAGLPSASIGLSTRYSIDPNGSLQLSVQTTLHIQGQSSWIAPSVSIRGRHHRSVIAELSRERQEEAPAP